MRKATCAGRVVRLAAIVALGTFGYANAQVVQPPQTKPAPAATAAAPAGAPKAAADLEPGTTSYRAYVQVGGQTIEIVQSIEVKAIGDTWSVTETSTTPVGTTTDRVVLEKGSLILKKRSTWQGAVTVEFEVKDNKATGTVKMSDQVMPIAIDLDGPLFADGAGAYQVVALLPLADGYTTSFRNLDVQAQKVTVQELRVVGSEEVTVPAGTFDAFRAELDSPGGGTKATLWVAKTGHKLVRLAVVASHENGLTVISELMK